MRIGTFIAADGGFAGHLQTLTLDIDLVLVPADPSDSGSAPDFRVIAGEGDEAREVGAGWKHVGEKAGDYVAIQIDDPAFIHRCVPTCSGAKATHMCWSGFARPGAKSRTEPCD